jgi:arylsulfatase A-like enzyme
VFSKTDPEDKDDSDAYMRFVVNENGTRVDYGADKEVYLTDVETDYATGFIDRFAPTGQPFFLFVSPRSPHSPRVPAPRHAGAHDHLSFARVPSLPEADLNDKPGHVRDSAQVRDPDDVDDVIRVTLDMTLSLDEMIRDVVAALDRNEVLDNTYVFFVSDNGRLRGEHNLAGKTAPYDEIVRAPLVVRGPGVEAGAEFDHFVSNVDFAPTVLEIADHPLPAGIDGESLLGVLAGEVGLDDWRKAALIEFRADTLNLPDRLDRGQARYPSYFGVYTPGIAYVEYRTGEVEIYDLDADPYQLDSMTIDEFVAEHGRDRLDELRSLLIALSRCSGADCAAAARDPSPAVLTFAWWCDAGRCTFDAVGTEPDAKHIWVLGDGNQTKGRRAVHEYSQPATYIVTLRVLRPDGESESAKLKIETE